MTWTSVGDTGAYYEQRPPLTVAWVNLSATELSMLDAARIVEAMNRQAPEVARAWPDRPVSVHGLVPDPHSVPAGAVPAYWLPDSDLANALGYHFVDPQGRPYIRVFTRPTLQNGGTVLRGANSIAVTSSHEACEEQVDPSCAEQATAPNGDVWALEDADPVEADHYDVSVSDGTAVSLSDFVYPAFFGRQNGPGMIAGDLDRLALLRRPFTLRPGGYAVVNGGQVFGQAYPDWKRETKEFPAARTYQRLHPAETAAARRA